VVTYHLLGYFCQITGENDKKTQFCPLSAFTYLCHSSVELWLFANRLYKFNDRELYRAEKEVKDVAVGKYDWRIERIDRGHGDGISR